MKLTALKRFSLGSIKRIATGDEINVNRDKAKCLSAFGLAGSARPTRGL